MSAIDLKSATEGMEPFEVTGLKVLVLGFQLSVLGALVVEMTPFLYVGMAVSVFGFLLE